MKNLYTTFGNYLNRRCIFSLFFLLLTSYVLLLPGKAQADVATQSGNTNIIVTVGGNSLSLSGYIAPFASIVLTVNNTVVASTVADALGNFSFSNLLVAKATSMVCLDAVDFKKLGESEACVSVTPVNGIISKVGVFLPPTLGVQRTDVFVGTSALAFGYGMPGATITVHINGSTGCMVTADSTGYYQCTINIQKAGDYTLFADSVLHGKPSETQLKKVLIKGIAFTKPTPLPPAPALHFPGLFVIPWWVWLLLVLIAIILIIILLRKYRPGLAIPGVGIPAVRFTHLFDSLFKKKKLHHSWMKGVGY